MSSCINSTKRALTGHLLWWGWDSLHKTAPYASACQTSDCVCFWHRSGEDSETGSGGAHLCHALQLQPHQPVLHPAETHAHTSHERLLLLPGELRESTNLCVVIWRITHIIWCVFLVADPLNNSGYFMARTWERNIWGIFGDWWYNSQHKYTNLYNIQYTSCMCLTPKKIICLGIVWESIGLHWLHCMFLINWKEPVSYNWFIWMIDCYGCVGCFWFTYKNWLKNHSFSNQLDFSSSAEWFWFAKMT